MRKLPFRQMLSLGLCTVLACPAVPAQTGKKSSQTPFTNATVKPDAKTAKKYADQGAKMEATGDYEGALAAYEEAARYAPFDVTIVSKGVALRARLVRDYVNMAERMAVERNMTGATEALLLALRIDPSNTILTERLRQMESMQGDRREHDNGLPREEPPEGLPILKPEKATHSFNLRAADVRLAYEQVAATYGIKASFDPELPGRTVRFRATDVDFDTAMKVMAAESGTFWRPLNAKLIFVAADSQEKRRAYDMEIEQTFPLTASVDATDMTELVRVVRDLTGAQHIQQSADAHSITIRDTVQRVRLAGDIIRQVEQARGEVLLQIDILEVDHDNAVKLGITPPASLRLITLSPGLAQQVRSASSVTALLTILATIFGTAATGGIASLASAIPPIAAIGGGKTTFLLTLPSFSADFSQALSLVQSGSQVLMRAQDSKPATFFVGERYPVTLSLLSGSLGSTPFTANPGGTGVTIPTQQFTVGRGPVSMVPSDVRSAGIQDLAVLNEIDNTITIFLNQGLTAASLFTQPSGSPISLGAARTTTPLVPAAIATGSFNSNTDSFADLLVTDPVGNTVTELLGNGDGTFVIQKNPIAVGQQPSAIAIGQFNTNTNANTGFVVTNFTDNTYTVFISNNDGTFTEVKGSPFPMPATATGPFAIAVGDYDRDGISDLAIVNQTSNNVTILKGRGDGTFSEFSKNSPIAVGNLPVAIAAGNLSGSTGPGLVVVNQQDNSASVLLGNGDGTFTPSSQSPLATDATPSGVVIGSFLQQSTSGIAITNTGSGTVSVYLDLGTGLYTSALEPAAGRNPGAIVSSSFTNSTFPDILVANNLPDAVGQVTLIVSPTSLISNPATNQQPYPGSEFIDLGLKVKATPSLHENHEVTLQMEFEIKALTGTSINGIPVLSNRNVTQTVRLKEDETSVLAGLLDRQETKSITGIPGMATLPGVGYAFGVRNNSLQNTELLILITPRRVRMPKRESRTIYAGRGELSGRGAATGGAPPAQPEPQPNLPPPGTGETPAEPTQQPPATQPVPQPVPEQPAPEQQPPAQPPPEQPNQENPPQPPPSSQ
jgi:type II secretory pathway component GspD/PulD (secretin)